MKAKIGGFIFLLTMSTGVYAQSSDNGKSPSLAEETSSKNSSKVTSEQKNKVQKAQMRFIGTFESGYKDAGIYKMVDVSDDVICYVLMPDNSSNRVVDGKLIYEANNVGAISCVKGK